MKSVLARSPVTLGLSGARGHFSPRLQTCFSLLADAPPLCTLTASPGSALVMFTEHPARFFGLDLQGFFRDFRCETFVGSARSTYFLPLVLPFHPFMGVFGHEEILHLYVAKFIQFSLYGYCVLNPVQTICPHLKVTGMFSSAMV